MAMVLRNASPAERADLVVRLVPHYAEAMVNAGEWSAHEALHKAQQDIDARLNTLNARQELLCIDSDSDGAKVGDLWLQYRDEGGLTVCVVLYISVDVHARGKGYAYAALLAAEVRAWQIGARAMRLSVNGNNAAGLGLYRKLGYGVLNARMGKPLQEKQA